MMMTCPRSHELLPTDPVSTSCHSEVCATSLRCSRDCLTAATALPSHARSVSEEAAQVT